jgi:hypothetical protein
MAEAVADPLPSWRPGAVKEALLAFVAAVSSEGSAAFVPEPERVAVFDNDGTLWPEQPLPFQAAFAFDELKGAVQRQPALAEDPMVQAALVGDLDSPDGRRAFRGSAAGDCREPCRHHHRGVCGGGAGLAGLSPPSPFRSPLRRPHLRADAGGAGAAAIPWFSQLHRVGRRRRLHARVGGAGVRHPARAGGGLHQPHQLRAARGRAGADEIARHAGGERRRRQAGGHPPVHRPPAADGLRQQRRRPGDAAIHHDQQPHAPALA